MKIANMISNELQTMQAKEVISIMHLTSQIMMSKTS